MAKIRKLREFEQGVVMTSGADESQAWCAVRQYDSPKAICSCIHSLRVDSFQSPPEPARHPETRVCDDCTMSALCQKGIVGVSCGSGATSKLVDALSWLWWWFGFRYPGSIVCASAHIE